MDSPKNKSASGRGRARATWCLMMEWLDTHLLVLPAVFTLAGVAAVVLEVIPVPTVPESADVTSHYRPPCLIQLVLQPNPEKGKSAGAYRVLYSDPGGPTKANNKVVHECAFDNEDQLAQALSSCENWMDKEKRVGLFISCSRVQEGACDPSLPEGPGKCPRSESAEPKNDPVPAAAGLLSLHRGS
jgi:hypothetical protein